MSDYIRRRSVFIGGDIVSLTDEHYHILQNAMFKEIWQERPHRCTITNNPLSIDGRTYYFHHILEKRAFEQYALCKWNIMILSYEKHNSYESNPNNQPLIHKYRADLLMKLDSGLYEFDNDHIWSIGDQDDELIPYFLNGLVKEP